eukprot:8469788-Pyramimonas_sp.AAC.1
MAIEKRFNGAPSWGKCLGPVSATYLTLERIKWHMSAAHIFLDDQGRTVNLLTTPPMELRQLLIDGVGRWQMARVLSHIPEAFGNEQ